MRSVGVMAATVGLAGYLSGLLLACAAHALNVSRSTLDRKLGQCEGTGSVVSNRDRR